MLTRSRYSIHHIDNLCTNRLHAEILVTKILLNLMTPFVLFSLLLGVVGLSATHFLAVQFQANQDSDATHRARALLIH